MSKKYIVWNYISESDLELIPEWFPTMPVEKPTLFARILNILGADPKHKWDVHHCEHRNRRGEIVTCYRYCFIERSDKSWLKSGMASHEAILCSYY